MRPSDEYYFDEEMSQDMKKHKAPIKDESPANAPAEPKFMIGQYVRYTDYHNRPQRGKVYDIIATWWQDGSAHISYRISHPTYSHAVQIGEDSVYGD